MPHEWVPDFLAQLRQSPNVSAAARAAGITRKAAYDHYRDDREFAAAWDDALDESTDELAGEAYRRAFQGNEKPIFHNGLPVGCVHEYSDTLTIFLLKAHRPAVYRETVRQEHSGPDGGAIAHKAELPNLSALTDDELDALDRITHKLAGHGPGGGGGGAGEAPTLGPPAGAAGDGAREPG